MPSPTGWQAAGSGFKYSDKTLSKDGIQTIQLKAGLPGKAKITLLGKKGGLPLPPLAPLGFPLPFTVQLGNAADECWESVYPTALINDGEQLRARF